MAFLTPKDLSPFVTGVSSDALLLMITDVEALALEAAPCLANPANLTPQQHAVAVSVLRGAVLRWVEHLTKDSRSMASGPFTIGPAYGANQERKPLLWPTEVKALSGLCAGSRSGGSRVGWLA